MQYRVVLFLAFNTFALASAARAQTVYRCGDSYSQVACAGATALDVSDSRSAVQKAEADAATTATRNAAASLERDRLAREHSQASAKPRPRAESQAPRSKGTPGALPSRKPAKPASPYFVATVPGEKKSAKKASTKAATTKSEPATNP